jgi:flagellar motor switch protein FliM
MSEVREGAATVSGYALFTDQGPTATRMPTLGPTLERINDRFSRFLRATLLQHLRRGVEVSSGSIELVRHRELIERFAMPTYIALVNMKPLHGAILIALDSQLVVSIVESRFGGTGRFPMRTGNRDFTAFELKSMRRVLDATLDQFALAWEPFGTFEPEVGRLETNPQFAGFAPPEEMIILNAFEVQIDQNHGRLDICIPYPAVEPMHGELTSGIAEDTIERDIRWSEELRSGLEQAAITLNVELGEIEISVADLVALRPGNVFEMDRPETLTVESGGVPLFRGRWGRYGRKIGLRIEERLSRPPEARKNGGVHGR